MKKWLVVQAYWYFDDITGEFHYRIKQPSEGLNETGHFDVYNVHVFHPMFPYLAENADLLILHLIPDVEITSLILFRKEKGLPTFFEIADNFLEVGPWMAAEDGHRNPKIRQNLLFNAHLCDGVQFNNSRLIEIFGDLHTNTMLFENQMDHLDPFRKDSRPFTVGWGGSIGHKTDLLAIRDSLNTFLVQNPETQFAYMGQEQLFKDLFSEFPSDQVRFQESDTIRQYYQFLKTVDLGIAPMENTAFNYCRSDIKHLEFASSGAGSLLSEVPAYREHNHDGETCYFFNSTDQFLSKLNAIYQNQGQMQLVVEKAITALKNHRWWKNQAQTKINIYKAHLKEPKNGQSLPPLPPAQSLINCLRVGIHYMEQEDYEGALHYMDKALNQMPTFHQAHYWKREVLLQMGKPQEVIQLAESYQPCPSHEQLLIQQLAAAAKTTRPEKFHQIRDLIKDPNQRYNLDPSLIPPVEMLQQNPFHYDSIMKLAEETVNLTQVPPEWIPFFKTGLKLDTNNSVLESLIQV